MAKLSRRFGEKDQLEILLIASAVNIALLQSVLLNFVFDKQIASELSWWLIQTPALTLGSFILLLSGVSSFVGVAYYLDLLVFGFIKKLDLLRSRFLSVVNFLILEYLLIALFDSSLTLANILVILTSVYLAWGYTRGKS